MALYIRECFSCTELKDNGDKIEYLWVKIRGKANNTDILIGVYYRQPSWDEGMDELSILWLMFHNC